MTTETGASGAGPVTVRVGRHKVRLTNLDKVLYPATGTTKADVLAYVAAVAPVMLPWTKGRAATRKRWPDGVEAEPFFEKNLPKGTPEWVKRVTLPHSDRDVTYPLVDDVATLTWIAQNAGLEVHVPQWRYDAKHPDRRRPDRLVLDLDPGPRTKLRHCVEVAQRARADLAAEGMDAVPVTSGSKGLHLYVHLNGTLTSDQASELAHQLAQRWEKEMPKLVVSLMRKDLRPGKVFVDWSQNSASKTTIAPYSLRGRERPTVAAPRTWEELEDPHVDQLLYTEVLERVEDGTAP